MIGNLFWDLTPEAERNRPAAVEDWLESLEGRGLPADDRNAAAYLLEGDPDGDRPLAAAVGVRLRTPAGTLPGNLPGLMLPEYLGEFAVREIERRIEADKRRREEGR